MNPMKSIMTSPDAFIQLLNQWKISKIKSWKYLYTQGDSNNLIPI